MKQRSISELPLALQVRYHVYQRAGYSIVLLRQDGTLCPAYSTRKVKALLEAMIGAIELATSDDLSELTPDQMVRSLMA